MIMEITFYSHEVAMAGSKEKGYLWKTPPGNKMVKFLTVHTEKNSLVMTYEVEKEFNYIRAISPIIRLNKAVIASIKFK